MPSLLTVKTLELSDSQPVTVFPDTLSCTFSFTFIINSFEISVRTCEEVELVWLRVVEVLALVVLVVDDDDEVREELDEEE